jgi:hypothetical protein
MNCFLYTVWFRDSSLEPDDQDHEWPACILIEAETTKDATEWGNHLSKQYSVRSKIQHFIRSYSEPVIDYSKCNLSNIPRVVYGNDATDEEIGW